MRYFAELAFVVGDFLLFLSYTIGLILEEVQHESGLAIQLRGKVVHLVDCVLLREIDRSTVSGARKEFPTSISKYNDFSKMKIWNTV